MTKILLTMGGFSLGAIPFSCLIGKIFLHKDIRNLNDGNPGATNVWKTGGWGLGLLAFLCDFLKGVIPAKLASSLFGMHSWEVIPIALSPVLGHAFSPFLRFKGGKAIAATFGMWIGLTFVEGPAVLGGMLFILRKIQKTYAWTLLMSMLVLFFYLLFRFRNLSFLLIWFGNILILTIKHRRNLRRPMRFTFPPRSSI